MTKKRTKTAKRPQEAPAPVLINPIRLYRRTKGLTQDDLGKKCGCTQQQVCLWERGVNIPGLAIMPKLAAALDKDTETLLREIMEYQARLAA